MRICTVCNIEKDETGFYQRKGRSDNRCIECHKSYRRQHYLDNKQAYVDKARRNNRLYKSRNMEFIFSYLKDNPCADCGEEDMRCLQFDHNDPSQKSFNISHAIHEGKNFESLVAEVSKCTVRCANCHAKKTAEQFQYPMYKGIYY